MEKRGYRRSGGDNRQGDRRRSGGDRDHRDKGKTPYFRKETREAEPTEAERLSELIARLGDKIGSSLERNISLLAQTLMGDMTKHKNHILDMLFKCVLALPAKTPIYGTLVGLLNSSLPDLGAEIVERVYEELKVAMNRFETYNMKYLVRFLAELMNAEVVHASTLLDVFDKLLAFEPTHNQGIRDQLCLIVMTTLPYGGHSLDKAEPARLAGLIDNLRKIIDGRVLEPNECVMVLQEDKPYPFINWVHDALVEHSKNGNHCLFLINFPLYMTDSSIRWPPLGVIVTPYTVLTEQLQKGKKHPFDDSNLELPALTENISCVPPRNVLRLFEGETHQLWSSRKMTPLERVVVEEYICDILYFFNGDFKDGIKHIMNIPIGMPFESVLDIVVETLFCELFTLPTPPFNRSYYALVFAELCKTSREYMPGVLAKAISIIYDHLDKLDIECYLIFTEWFGHHLSNFDYKWLWLQWKEVPSQQHADFITEVLYRCIRLSYHERVERTLPSELLHRLPEKSRPNFKYLEGPTVEGYKAAQGLYNKLKNKETAEVVISWIESSDSPINSLSPIMKVDVLISCLLQVGSKSFSHLLATVERYITVLRKYISDHITALQVVVSVIAFWKHAPQRIIISLNKFITFRIVPPSAIVEWVFSDEVTPLLRKQWVWELLFNAIDQTIETVDMLQKKLGDMDNPGLNPDTMVEEKETYKHAEDNLAAALQEQRKFFLILFQRFEILLKKLIELIRKEKEDLILKKSRDMTDVEYTTTTTAGSTLNTTSTSLTHPTSPTTTSQTSQNNGEQENSNTSSTPQLPSQPPSSQNPEAPSQYIPPEPASSEYIYKIALGTFKAVGRKHYKHLRVLCETLNILLSNTEPSVAAIYLLFKSLIDHY